MQLLRQAPDDPAPYKDWTIGPFLKQDAANPILGACFGPRFICPVRKKPIRWQARAMIGAAAIVRDGKLCLIFHAEDTESGYAGLRGSPGTMRLGLAESKDGLHVTGKAEPVLYPDEDFMRDGGQRSSNRRIADFLQLRNELVMFGR